MYEPRHRPLISRREFAHRLLVNFAIAMAFVAFALTLGTVGYHGFAGLGWIDAFLNASMILTGMGPVAQMNTDGAKIWASCYALFSGIAFLGTVTVMLAPLAHRFLHKFHIEEQG